MNLSGIRCLKRAVLTAALLGSLALADEPCPHHPPAPATADVTVHSYDAPDVQLVDQDGQRRALREVLKDGGPVALNFVFTTCTTVCPVMGAGFAGLRKRMGELRLVSISIDPEHDRPQLLKAWVSRFGGDARWSLYTGATDDVRRVLDAFEATRGDKSNHRPFTLLRRAGETTWIRVDGLASTEALVRALATR